MIQTWANRLHAKATLRARAMQPIDMAIHVRTKARPPSRHRVVLTTRHRRYAGVRPTKSTTRPTLLAPFAAAPATMTRLTPPVAAAVKTKAERLSVGGPVARYGMVIMALAC